MSTKNGKTYHNLEGTLARMKSILNLMRSDSEFTRDELIDGMNKAFSTFQLEFRKLETQGKESSGAEGQPVKAETKFKIVHIEDDAYLRASWKMAAKKLNISILSLKRPEDFLPYMESVSSDTIFFIDEDFGKYSPLKGSEWSRGLNASGFQKLFLTTGTDQSKFTGIDHLTAVLTKEFPKKMLSSTISV